MIRITKLFGESRKQGQALVLQGENITPKSTQRVSIPGTSISKNSCMMLYPSTCSIAISSISNDGVDIYGRFGMI